MKPARLFLPSLLLAGSIACPAVRAQTAASPDATPPVAAAAAAAPPKSAVSVVTNAMEVRRAFDKPAPDLDLRNLSENGKSEILYLEKTPLLDQRAVKSAIVKREGDQTVIELTLTEIGKQSVAEVTKNAVGQRLAILINGKVVSAPVVRDAVTSGTLQITGNFNDEEARVMASKISTATPKRAAQPSEVTFTGTPESPISAAVAVPEGRALFLTSGTVPPMANADAPSGSRERYGDTKTQGIGALRQIETQLAKAGLGMKDVIYLRVYVAADKAKDGKFDYPGWFDAYGQFFGTKDNPIKPARSTVGVASLVNADWLIEIEAVAAYPARSAGAEGEDAVGEKKSAAVSD